MSLKLAPVTKEDASAISTILIAAFEHDPYQRIEYPTAESLVGLHRYETNKTRKLTEDPARAVWKVVDATTGRILSFARLSSPSTGLNVDDADDDDGDEDDWPDGCNKEMCVPFMAKLKEMKRKVLKDTPCYRRFRQ